MGVPDPPPKQAIASSPTILQDSRLSKASGEHSLAHRKGSYWASFPKFLFLALETMLSWVPCEVSRFKSQGDSPNHTWTRKQAKEMYTRSNSALLPEGSVLRSGATGWDQALWLPLRLQESSPHLKVAHTVPEMWGSASGLWELHSISLLLLAKHLPWVYQHMSVPSPFQPHPTEFGPAESSIWLHSQA